MKKGDVVGGYVLTTDAREGGGHSQWAFAERDGAEFFIKRFLSPTYPVPGGPGSEKTKAAKRKRCEEFESRHRLVMNKLRWISGDGGTLEVTKDFFRDRAHYYKVTSKVDVSDIGPKRVASMPSDDQIIIMLTASRSLDTLHKAGLVHGDVKPENLLIKGLGKSFAVKVIDFDNCFAVHKPPMPDQLVGDPAYYSPELLQYNVGRASGDQLDGKSDVFALGLVFWQYLTGERPRVPDGFSCAAEAVQEGAVLSLPKVIKDRPLADLILSMLAKTPSDRPSMGDVHRALKMARRSEMDGVSSTSSSEPLKRGLVGKLRGSSDFAELEGDEPTTGKPVGDKPGRLRGKLITEKTSDGGAKGDSGEGRLRGSLAKVRGGEASPEPVIGRRALAGDVVAPVPEQRFLQGRFPERVRLGEEVSLLVRLGLQPGARLEAGLRPLAVPEAGLDVVLLLVENPGFTLRSPERAVVHVIPRQDSNWAGFELQAARQGVHTLQVEAFAGGTGLGGLSVQVSVDPIARTGPSMERTSPAGITRAHPGEISLLLSYDPDHQVYRYRLVDSSGYYSEEAASDRLLQPPGEAIEQLVGQLNMLARGQAAWDAATTKDWLQGQGIALWNSFIPQALQREFWQRRDEITQMTVVSQGDPVPWELLYPFAPGGQDAGFLVDQFPVVRRRYGPRPPSRLELGAADLVLSGDGSLAAAQAEIAVLDGLLRGRGLAARRIGDLPSLLQAFQRGDIGLLHFSCHNAFARRAPNASRILLGSQPFEPVFLEAHAGRFTAPLVFLNACRTDGQAALYTTVEGWAASFLRAGAGAFIGSLWEVTDTSACTYAQEFYRAALGGHTLAESARQARDAIRDNPGDPTWLAYTLYGDPAATASTHPPRTD
jgi:hypothetical protein